MDIQIKPGLLEGDIEAVSSKSHAHRLAIAAFLADAPVEITWNQVSNDIQATLHCLTALGARFSHDDRGVSFQAAEGAEGAGGAAAAGAAGGAGAATLPCAESGTTLRLLLPVAAARAAEATFYGSGRLGERPLEPLLQALAEHGCQIERLAGAAAPEGGPTEKKPVALCEDIGEPIVRISGGLKSGVFELPGDVSSQFVSGLLLALPLLDGPSEIHVTSELVSRAYVDMTLDVLADFDVTVSCPDEQTFVVPGGQAYKSPGRIQTEGDWSNAAFWLAANALGSEIDCRGLLDSSVQGDREIEQLLEQYSATMGRSQACVQANKPVLIEAAQVPDLVPILAVVAGAKDKLTVFSEVSRLQGKESDRVAAVIANLVALGVEAYVRDDQLFVRGTGQLTGGLVDGFGDHRIVMAMAIAATVCTAPLIIRGAEATRKSYPGFLADFKKLGGNFNVL